MADRRYKGAKPEKVPTTPACQWEENNLYGLIRRLEGARRGTRARDVARMKLEAALYELHRCVHSSHGICENEPDPDDAEG